VAYRYRKPYRVKRKKSVLRSRFFWIAVLALFFVGSACYFVFFSGFFQIKEVKISGINKVSLEEILSFFPKENIFLANMAGIESDILKRFPEIAELKINRNFPDALEVEVKERQAVLVWCKEECFLIDKTGLAFEKASLEETDLVKVLGEQDLLVKETVAQILEILLKLEKDLKVDVKEIVLVSSQRMDLETLEGWQVYFSLDKDLSLQLTRLHLVLERQISQKEREVLQYIDLRFEKVYYK